MIQIRHVSDEVHAELKQRAAAAGMSLSDYLRVELERLVAKKPMAQVFQEMEPYRTVTDDQFDALWAEVRAERDR